jgi:hypothetical protein
MKKSNATVKNDNLVGNTLASQEKNVSVASEI